MTDILQRVSAWRMWRHKMLNAFVVGSSRAFLAVAGGTTPISSFGHESVLPPKALIGSVLMGGILGVSHALTRGLPKDT